MTYIDPHHAEIQQLFRELGQMANGIIPTRIPLEPRPSEIRAMNDDLLVLARKVDPIIEAIGRYVAAHTPGRFDQSLFKDVLFNAMDGNALFEITDAADALRDDIMQAAE